MSADIEKNAFSPNPTGYLFHASIGAVAEAVAALSHGDARFKGFLCPETTSGSEDRRRFSMAKPFGRVNAYAVYFYKKKPADYLAVFEVTLHAETKDRTQVQVSVNGPRISVPGHGFNIHSFRFDQNRTIGVEATTIEEYEILLGIGKILNERGLPPLTRQPLG